MVVIFDCLPDDIIQQIIDEVQDVETLGQLSVTCHRLHYLCHIPYLTQSLFGALVPIADIRLPPLIHQLAFELRIAPPELRHHCAITLEDATGLFDQLTMSHQLLTATKIECVRALIPYFHAFTDIVLAPDYDRCPRDLIARLADLRTVPDPALGIPDCVTQAVRAFSMPADTKGYTGSTVNRVRRHYRPPFDRVFPHNGAMAAHICACHGASLGQYAVVLALQRNGIRFELFDFVAHVQFDAARSRLFLPLLYWPRPAACAYQLVVWYISRGRLDHAKALFGCRRFCQQVRADPIGFLDYLTKIENVDLGEFLNYFVTNPFMEELVSRTDPRRDHCRALLHLAIIMNEFRTGIVVMKLPGLDVIHGLPPSQSSVLDLLQNNRRRFY